MADEAQPGPAAQPTQEDLFGDVDDLEDEPPRPLPAPAPDEVLDGEAFGEEGDADLPEPSLLPPPQPPPQPLQEAPQAAAAAAGAATEGAVVAAATEAASPHVASTARERLAELAKRKREEAEALAAEEQQRKKSQRTSASVAADEEGGGGAGPALGAGAGADPRAIQDLFGEDEEQQEEEAERADAAPTAYDDEFIDDDGAAPREGGLEERRGHTSEAEEDPNDPEVEAPLSEADDDEAEDDFERVFQAKGRAKRAELSQEDVRKRVSGLLDQMEHAANMDMERHAARHPAVFKLQLLQQVESAVVQRALHEELLDAGVLGVLKAWLEPMRDGSLPNLKVRSSVLRWLTLLPVDTHDEQRKSQLKASKVGHFVMFLSQVPDESAANKRLAKALVEKWSRPIFDQHRDPTARTAEEEAANAARQRVREAAHEAEVMAASDALEAPPVTEGMRPSDTGFRWHASIPQPARLDYVVRPKSHTADAVPRAGGARTGSKLARKLKALGTKRAGPANASKVSVEGRGMAM